MTLDIAAPGVYRVRVPIPFDLDHVNLYLVETGGRFVLVDTGVATEEAFSAVATALHVGGIDFHDIEAIVLTHFHADHAGLAGRLAELADAPIVMSEVDAVAADTVFGERAATERPEFFASHGAPASLASVLDALLPMLRKLTGPFTPSRAVRAGDRLASGREMIAVLTPGHTAGHLAIDLPTERLLLAGDHVLPHITPNIGLYPTSPPSPLRSYLESLDATRRLAPRRILPAHGEIIEEPEERLAMLVNHHRRRIDDTLSAVSSEATAWNVTERLFGEGLDAFQSWLALFESLAHLEYLVDDGALRREEQRGRIVYRRA
jgi:glyoxylase-like metal-dependent hydrolase (beta-lactamase superfamily II)